MDLAAAATAAATPLPPKPATAHRPRVRPSTAAHLILSYLIYQQTEWGGRKTRGQAQDRAQRGDSDA